VPGFALDDPGVPDPDAVDPEAVGA
jgi:hypothetical protein